MTGDYDIVVRGGTLVDGTGAEPVVADAFVGIHYEPAALQGVRSAAAVERVNLQTENEPIERHESAGLSRESVIRSAEIHIFSGHDAVRQAEMAAFNLHRVRQ